MKSQHNNRVREFERNKNLFFVTRNGVVKIELTLFDNIKKLENVQLS